MSQLNDDEKDHNLAAALDEAQLVREARYIDRFEGLDLSWLPPGR